jgi:hypothetical protein
LYSTRKTKRRLRPTLLGLALASVSGGVLVWACSTPYDSAPNGPDGSDASADALSMNADTRMATDASVDGACSWFCDDFDHDPWPPPGYDPKKVQNGGQIDLISTVSQSPPRSLRAFLAQDAGSSSGARYPRTYLGNASALHCAISVQVIAAGTDAIGILELTGKSPKGNWDIVLNIEYPNVVLYEGANVQFLPRLPIGGWTRIGIDMKLGQPTVVTFNGAVENDTTKSPAADAGALTFASSIFQMGAIRYTAPAMGDWRVAFDDVACSIDP